MRVQKLLKAIKAAVITNSLQREISMNKNNQDFPFRITFYLFKWEKYLRVFQYGSSVSDNLISLINQVKMENLKKYIEIEERN